ncbi:MAG: PHP domain-containing protein [Desulfobacterales bacterium]
MKIDLHIHSTASDGTCTPAEILRLAGEMGIGIFSITDHDTVAGSKEILGMEIPPPIRFIPGLEISAQSPDSFPCAGSFHILGYNMDVDDSVLNQTLEVLREARRNRNPRIIENLTRMGFDLSMEELIRHAGDSQIGRPHIAGLMLKKGFVQSIDEAFDKYIGTGKPAYVDKYRISSTEAITMIRNAGGTAVLAHPGLLKPLIPFSFEEMILHLRKIGLCGIEVWYPEHSAEQTACYAQVADRCGLIKTGGTDFHGAVKPGLQMGIGRGDFRVPYSAGGQLILCSA